MNRLLFAIFAVLLMGCAQRDVVRISGKIDNLTDTALYIEAGGKITDTIVVTDGSFSIEIPSEPMRIVNIAQRELIEGGVRMNYLVNLITQAGKITVEGAMNDKITAKGSPLNDKFQMYRDSAIRISNEFLKEQDPAKRSEMQKEFLELKKSTVKDNSDNIFGVYLLTSFDPSSEYTKVLVDGLSENMQQRDEIVQLKKRIEINSAVKVGNKAKNIDIPDVEGNQIALNDVITKNKYVLLDFWASWCGPCMAEMPELVKTYAEYKSRGFEIYAVSLDDKKVMWLNAVQNNKMSWINVSDLLGPSSAVAADYGIRAIPDNFIIDGNGVIVARGLRGEELGKKIKELFDQ